MGLAVPQLSYKNFHFSNWGTNPSNTPGLQITAGTSNSEGSWTEIATSSNITADITCFTLWLVALSGTGDRQMLIDIGIDPAGGTSYTAIISNIVCGNMPINQAGLPNYGIKFVFPMHIPAGSSVAVRAQGSSGTAQTVYVNMEFWGSPSAPHAFPCASFSETIGTITNSQGVSFTPGNVSDGSWVSLGTTSSSLWWWQLCYSIGNATIGSRYTFIELAWGDGSNKHLIMKASHSGTTSEVVVDTAGANSFFMNCYHPVPAGATLYVRGRCSTSPETGYNAVAVGLGG